MGKQRVSLTELLRIYKEVQFNIYKFVATFLKFIRIKPIFQNQNNFFLQNKYYNLYKYGRMVELVDAPDSKSGGSNTLRVRVSLRPPSYGYK